MNLKTTLVLLVLTLTGGVWFFLSPALPPFLGLTAPAPNVAPATALTVLEKELTAANLHRIEVRRGDRQVILVKGKDGVWTIDGKWMTRPREVEELVGLLTNLRSRFAPIPIQDTTEYKSYGLEPPALTVQVRCDNEQYLLKFGEDPGDSNRFTRSTYLLPSQPQGERFKSGEVYRLAPGLVAALDRPVDYYLQRRLFPSERVVKGADSQEKVDRLVAASVSAQSKDSTFTLTQAGKEWELKEPVRDRLDPDKIQSILTAVPDIWAEHFVRNPKKDLAEYGLDKPEQTLTIARNGGDKVTLLVGKKSDRKGERKVTRPAPPQFGQMPPITEKVVEEFHYAKLDGNEQIFEIKADKLKDVFVGLDTLRDSKLARFKTEDVQRIDLTLKDTAIVLVKKDGKWRLEKPVAADAETSKVTELVDKLAQLDAKGADVIDKADAKEYSLEPPAGTVAVTVEEEVKGTGDEKEKKTRTLRFQVGKHDAEKKKLYVRVDDWPRVNAVDDSVLKLVERPALAYRSRSIFDLAGKDLEQIDVQRGDEKYALKKVDDKWRLTVPVDAAADLGKASNLAGDLTGLNVVEYVAEDAKEEDLDKLYGLAKPALSVTLRPKGADAKPLTLQIGKQREGKPEFFAKLEGAAQVFAIRKDLRDQLDQSSLALRPLQLWQVPVNDLASLRIQKQAEPEFSLKRDGMTWKVAGPFDAAVGIELVQPILGNLATLKIDKYETHAGKELDKYGLDKPYLRVVVREADRDKEAGKEHTLLIGKPTAENAKTRYAKPADSDAIVIVGEALVSAIDRGALDMLDRNLLRLDKEEITRVKSSAGDSMLTLDHKDSRWNADTGQAKFTADGGVVAGVLSVWFNLKAERFAGYGTKLDLANYGLDKPAQTITISVQPPAEEGKPAAKPVEHTLALGKQTDGPKGERYARLDDQPGVVVLSAAAVTELSRPYLDFVDRTLLTIDSSAVSGIHRKMGEQELEIAKRDDGWHISKPEAQRADGPSLQKLLQQLGRLRAQRVAAYPAKDLKAFGLDDPAAIVTLRLTDGEGKTKDHILKIGESADAPGQTNGDRYAQVDGGDKVAVLPGSLVRPLVAKPLTFRDHALAKFVDADKVFLERGPRKAVFAKVDGNWKLTEPTDAEADQTELDDFINALARLRADELVSDKPEDLKPFGLDQPEVRWRFLAGDKEVLGLLIGEREKTKAGEPARCYAKLTTGETVFLLDPKLTSRVLGEYRNRKLWEPIDAAQVVRLDFMAGGGDPQRKSFGLEMIDNAWHVAGKPEAKLNTSAVNDALAALASLRAERFVVDKGADLKLFGLEPTHLTIEVRTRTGAKRTLQIGAREGESKRHYARVAEGNRSDVFVISDGDAAKIVRDLAAFTEGAEKPKSD